MVTGKEGVAVAVGKVGEELLGAVGSGFAGEIGADVEAVDDCAFGDAGVGDFEEGRHHIDTGDDAVVDGIGGNWQCLLQGVVGVG